jgi:hypothetical protein
MAIPSPASERMEMDLATTAGMEMCHLHANHPLGVRQSLARTVLHSSSYILFFFYELGQPDKLKQ